MLPCPTSRTCEISRRNPEVTMRYRSRFTCGDHRISLEARVQNATLDAESAMFRLALFVVFFQTTAILCAGETTKAATAKKAATALGDAMLRGDDAKIIDGTYETIVKKLGGREKA